MDFFHGAYACQVQSRHLSHTVMRVQKRPSGQQDHERYNQIKAKSFSQRKRWSHSQNSNLQLQKILSS